MQAHIAAPKEGTIPQVKHLNAGLFATSAYRHMRAIASVHSMTLLVCTAHVGSDSAFAGSVWIVKARAGSAVKSVAAAMAAARGNDDESKMEAVGCSLLSCCFGCGGNCDAVVRVALGMVSLVPRPRGALSTGVLGNKTLAIFVL